MDISFLTLNKIAHRGIHDKYMENTLKSFLECIKRGYLIELDVRLTKDNYVVVFHDISLKRLFNKNKNITDLTLNELREYKFIPTLEEVLDLVRGRVPIIIEIKYDKRISILVKELFKLLDNYEGNFSISSFYLKPLIYIYRYRPNYIRGYLISSYIPRTIIIKLLLSFNLLRLNFLCIDKKVLSNSYILSLRDKYLIIGYIINSYYEYYLYKGYADNFIWDSYK